ncbi:GEM-like protein 7 [Impatiens glandulifera]|uniref:GEM-like protein 7 n=1 Tax=Impatiens glandulifera TaxID=253017 RepID=UPI001FB19621|nr:GEM-like protein 7 [Impatiens glandulifera]
MEVLGVPMTMVPKTWPSKTKNSPLIKLLPHSTALGSSVLKFGSSKQGFNVFSSTVRRKLRLGAKIIQNGGLGKVFKRSFKVMEGEKLERVTECSLSTTAGPIAGLLFISTQKIAFCSEKSIKIFSHDQTGHNQAATRLHYKVSIPLGMISKISESKNESRPAERYIRIDTVDNYDFWFMGFSNYRRTFEYLLQRSHENVLKK